MFGRRKTVRVRYWLGEEHNGGEIPEHHEWFMPGAIEYRRFEEDSKLGLVTCMLLECENPGCNGRAYVRLVDLLSVPLGEIQPDPPGTRERYDAEMKKQQEANEENPFEGQGDWWRA